MSSIQGIDDQMKDQTTSPNYQQSSHKDESEKTDHSYVRWVLFVFLILCAIVVLALFIIFLILLFFRRHKKLNKSQTVSPSNSERTIVVRQDSGVPTNEQSTFRTSTIDIATGSQSLINRSPREQSPSRHFLVEQRPSNKQSTNERSDSDTTTGRQSSSNQSPK